jgi:hypothetical protein
MELLGILLIGFFSWASWNMFEFYTWFKFSSFFLALDTHIFFFFIAGEFQDHLSVIFQNWKSLIPESLIRIRRSMSVRPEPNKSFFLDRVLLHSSG